MIISSLTVAADAMYVTDAVHNTTARVDIDTERVDILGEKLYHPIGITLYRPTGSPGRGGGGVGDRCGVKYWNTGVHVALSLIHFF